MQQYLENTPIITAPVSAVDINTEVRSESQRQNKDQPTSSSCDCNPSGMDGQGIMVLMGLTCILSTFISLAGYGYQIYQTAKNDNAKMATLKTMLSLSVLAGLWMTLNLVAKDSIKNSLLHLSSCFDEDGLPRPTSIDSCNISAYEIGAEFGEQMVWGLVASVAANIVHAVENYVLRVPLFSSYQRISDIEAAEITTSDVTAEIQKVKVSNSFLNKR